MGILKKPYEISIWTDTLSNGAFVEEKIAIIGSNTMTTQCRALEPKLKRNVNGSNELTFKMYRRYKDNFTGEEIQNPFVDLIANETKIKLLYKNKWYDFLVKNIAQDSNNLVYSYTVTDLHIIELSKNGYGLVLDSSLMNNSGTAKELADKILADTDWIVEVEESLDQFIEEPLVKMLGTAGISPNADSIVLVPYSSLKGKPYFFQYFNLNAKPDDDGIYRGKEQQSAVVMTGSNVYVTDETASKYGFYYPSGWHFVVDGNGNIEFSDKRGERLVYTHKSNYNPILDKVVYYYSGQIDSAENEEEKDEIEVSSIENQEEEIIPTYAGFTETKYITPNLIQNLITNTKFKSTDGWKGSYSCDNSTETNNKGSDYNAKVEVSTNPDMKNAILNGDFNLSTLYTPYLRMTFPQASSCVVNTGFFDNRKIIKNLQALQKFVLFYKPKHNPKSHKFQVLLNEETYDITTGHFVPNNDKPNWLTFSSESAIPYPYNKDDENEKELSGYEYIIGSIKPNYKYTEAEFQKKKIQLMFQYKSEISAIAGANTLEFYDIQIFPYIPNPEKDNAPLVPSSQALKATTITTYNYYDIEKNPSVASLENNVLTAKDFTLISSEQPNKGLIPICYTKKIRSINIKQSNYFNAIQTLCETFGCWADFVIEHEEDGQIKSKKIVIKEHNNRNNYAGFKYKVNLKQTKRTIDSKAIVTKLIVPDNVNSAAPNGFCSIARAASNETGENYIYNFQYYINQKLINKQKLNEYLSSYYQTLLQYNNSIKTLNEQKLSLSRTLDQASSDLQIAENGRNAASELFQENVEAFFNEAGFDYTEINTIEGEIDKRKGQIENSASLTKYLTIIVEQYAAYQKYAEEFSQAETVYKNYKKQVDDYETEIKNIQEDKSALNLAFFKKFYRYIQEGTWKGDDYIDNEKYYIDALSTSTESCLPKVTYTFNVLDLSVLDGYENFEFELADKTWVEDPEFFGYNEDGTPYKEEVIITEITYSLDEPDKNSIKIQNFKDSFADLFQKQTATVQAVQFAKDAWSKAGAQSTAPAAQQMQQIQNALTNSQMVYMNPGDQSVIQDNEGITVTDMDVPSRQIRLVGGAILARDPDGDGTSWRVLLSPEGINAKMITAGQIDTSVLQIMNKDEPYFRWDALGLTAYYFDENDNKYLHGLDTNQGVRFDRFGLYGYRGVDGLTWHPSSIDDIEKNAQFALTWDGLFLNLGHSHYDKYYRYDNNTDAFVSTDEDGKPLKLPEPIWHASTASIGKTNNYIYNSWVSDPNSTVYNQPYYDPNSDNPTFAKVVAIGGTADNQKLVIYDDGTLVAEKVKLVGDIEWTTASSPSKSVYGRVELTTPPADGTPYSAFEESDKKDEDGNAIKPFVWHKIVAKEDVYYCHTDDGGATWQGPFLITGRSVVGSEIQYAVEEKGLEPATLPEKVWSSDFPIEGIDGKCIYTRSRDIYDNAEVGEWGYTAGFIGTSPIVLLITTSTGNMYVNNDISATLTVTANQDNKDITDLFETEAFLWEKYDADGTKDENWGKRGTSIQISSADIYKKAVFNCILDVDRRV